MRRFALLALTLVSCAYTRATEVGSASAELAKLRIYLPEPDAIYTDSDCAGAAKSYASEVRDTVAAKLRLEGLVVSFDPKQAHDLRGSLRLAFIFCGSSADNWGANARLRIEGSGRLLSELQLELNGNFSEYGVPELIGRAMDDGVLLAYAQGPHDTASAEAEPAPIAAAEPPKPGPTPSQPTAPIAAKRVAHVVAVFDIEDSAKSFEAGVTDQVTDYLIARIAIGGAFRVLPRDAIKERLLVAKSEGFKACYDQSCQIELGKALAAEKSLSTKLLRLGGVCAMTATLYDLRTETTERSASARTECNPAALLGGVDRMVDELRAE